jgi:T5SS/PEP-CTERM-associated repeat protein
MSVLVAAGETTSMKYTPALCAALGLGALLTPLARGQTDLYVGSNTPANTLDFTNGTNVYGNTYVGFTVDASNNALGVANAGTLLTNSGNIIVGGAGSGNSLVISGGGTVAAVAATIGADLNSTGNSVLVTGTNSVWANSETLLVGNSGSGNSLVMSNGGMVTAGLRVAIGLEATASNNAVLVTGTGSVWTNSDDLYVGEAGSGNSLVISNGGTVANGFGIIGLVVASSNNSVLVTGEGSVWSNSLGLVVGDYGSSNSLTISDGGLVANDFGYVGYGVTSSNNSVLVTGAGSVWTNSGDLYVGYSGTSHRMVIADGGTVYNVNGYDDGASPLDSSNSVLVTDAGSAWVNSGNLTFGLAGHDNSLIISNGGLVTVGTNAYAGDEATASNNSVLVTGTNAGGTASTLSVVGSLFVGNNGSGNSLVISNGGTVVNKAAYIGAQETSSNNSVLVTGSGSTWTSSTNLYVGYFGRDNSLVISNGGTVANSAGYIGVAGTFDNAVLVTGAGSLWTNSLDLYVGSVGGGNSLVISNGGTVANSTGYIGSESLFFSSDNAVLVTGADSLWTNSNFLEVGIGGSGNSLVISNGGTVADRAAAIGVETSSSNNNVVVTGTNSAWVNSEELFVGLSGQNNTMVISNGGTVAAAVGFIGTESESTGNNVLVTGAGSLWTNSAELSVGFFGSSNSLTVAEGGKVSASRVEIGSSGTVNIGRFGTNDAAGTINAPTIAFGDGTGAINFNQRDAVTITSAISGAGTINQLGGGATTLSASNTYTGATTVSAGRLVVDGSIASSAVTVQSGGTLAGSGTVGSTTIESGGTVSPGNSPGNLTVDGDLVWNGGGNYNWQVLGTTNTAGFAAGATWDLLTVTGTLDLTALSAGSKFNINLWSLASTGPDIDGNIADFDPTTGYEWLAVVASNITGFDASSFEVNYAATNGTAGFSNLLDPGYTFGVRQDGGNLYVAYEVVPEPSTYALLAVAAAGCGAHLLRRRKRGKVS